MTNLDVLDDESEMCLQKLWGAAERVYTDRAMLFDDNELLLEHSNENAVRVNTKATMVGRAKVMSNEDIVAAQRKRNEKAKAVAAISTATTAFIVPTAVMVSRAYEEMMQSSGK